MQNMRFVLIIVMLAVFVALIAYVVLRGFQTFRDIPMARNIYLITTVSMFVFFIAGMIVGMFSTASIAKIIAFIGQSSLFILFYLILAFVLIDIVRTANHFLHFAPEGMIAFRKYALFVSFAVIAVLLVVGNYKFNRIEIVNLEINVKDKPLKNRELRIVAASDIHLGVSIDKRKLQKYVRLINEQNPDIVVLVGDIIDNALAPLVRQNMDEYLRKINAPLGVFLALGNHEYIGGDIYGVIDFFQSANVQVLRDEIVLIDDSFYLVGRDDLTNRYRKPISQLIEGIDHSKPIILLDHQPFNLQEAEKNGIDLQISGHTHAGQFFPINLIVNRMFENPHGHSMRGNTHFYVSSGLAIWGPQYRIGTQSELVVITLSF